MRTRIFTPLLLVLSMAAPASPVAAANPPGPGRPCSVIGQVLNLQGKSFTCVKQGRQSVWNGGAEVAAACKLADSATPQSVVSAGFPNPSDLVGKQRIRILGLYVDFADMRGEIAPREDAAPIIAKFDEFYRASSYGRVTLEWTVPNKYFSLPRSVGFYQFSLKAMETRAPGSENIWRFPQDVIDAADSEINFADFDALIIFTPPQATDAEIGDVSPGDLKGEIGYRSQEGTVRNIRSYVGSWRSAAWGSPAIGDEYRWRGLVHEFGHILGLADLYVRDNVHRFDSYVGQFDVMGVPQYGLAPELFAWARWQLGWLQDLQVVCASEKFSLVDLTPVESQSGKNKLVVIPISKTEAIAIESRRRIGFDARMSRQSEGALVYRIDVSKPSQQGPIRIESPRLNVAAPQVANSNLFKDAPLKVGDILNVAGLRIRVLASSSTGDRVEIRR